MKTIKNSLLVALAAASLLLSSNLQADDYHSKSSSSSAATPTQYLIVVPHTPEECLNALDETKAMGADKLARWDWGCAFGDHTAYIIVDAKSEAEALALVPPSERGKAKLTKLTKVTAAQIEAFHQMKK